jgi:predicted methyltransferase
MTEFATRRQVSCYAAAGILGVAILACCLGSAGARAQDYAAVVASADRSDVDRQTDQRREPVKLLAFTGAKSGMKVLDMGAGGGYSTELLARTVAPNGVVYAQNSTTPNERAKQTFDARIKTPAMKNVIPVVRDYGDPIPPELADLDLVTFFFAYHDVTFMEVDRAAMNKKLFAALKPGGFLVIADHSAKPGDGTSVGKTLHRIEESALRKELEAAGFRLFAEADFLRHPEDARDVAVSKAPTPVDEFVLKFQRP